MVAVFRESPAIPGIRQPFPRLPSGRSDFQVLRLPTNARLMISGEKWRAQSASRRRTCQRSQRRHFQADQADDFHLVGPTKRNLRENEKARKPAFRLINPAATSNENSAPTRAFYQTRSCQQPSVWWNVHPLSGVLACAAQDRATRLRRGWSATQLGTFPRCSQSRRDVAAPVVCGIDWVEVSCALAATARKKLRSGPGSRLECDHQRAEGCGWPR
jgi:hypothetical protein